MKLVNVYSQSAVQLRKTGVIRTQEAVDKFSMPVLTRDVNPYKSGSVGLNQTMQGTLPQGVIHRTSLLMRNTQDVIALYAQNTGMNVRVVRDHQTEQVIQRYKKLNEQQMEFRKKELLNKFNLKRMILIDDPQIFKDPVGQVMNFVI